MGGVCHIENGLREYSSFDVGGGGGVLCTRRAELSPITEHVQVCQCSAKGDLFVFFLPLPTLVDQQMHNSHAGCGSDSALTVHCFAWNTTEVELKVDFFFFLVDLLLLLSVQWNPGQDLLSAALTLQQPRGHQLQLPVVWNHTQQEARPQNTHQKWGWGMQSEHTLTNNLRLSYIQEHKLWQMSHQWEK